ncbi:hypothetical protein AJ88_15225 [Mesorhizobium amorphae CCBAU 01583]|nr:hypothetical protein AJ88_15225 [Mesorhizobium amorphae CCBAU 01583]
MADHANPVCERGSLDRRFDSGSRRSLAGEEQPHVRNSVDHLPECFNELDVAFSRFQCGQHQDHGRLWLTDGRPKEQMRFLRPLRVGEARQIEAGVDDMVLIGAAQMIGDADVAHRLADIDESAREVRRQALGSQEHQPLRTAHMHERQNVHAMDDAWDIGFPGSKAADDAGFALVRMHDVRPPIAHEARELPECRDVAGW